jgi:hypothetical protein
MTHTQYLSTAADTLSAALGNTDITDAVAIGRTAQICDLATEDLADESRDCTVWENGEKHKVTCKVLKTVSRTIGGKVYQVPVYESVQAAAARQQGEQAAVRAEQQGEFIPEATEAEMAAIRHMFS